MHVILVPFGSVGDVYPFVALGRELRGRGHRVPMIASAYFSGLACASGFEFAASVSSEDYLSLIGHPDFWPPQRSAPATQ
jgi:rhamnosyltransferase subunit B